MSVSTQSNNNDILNDATFKENIRNISKLYVTKKFNPAFELCENCIKPFEVENSINIFEKIKEDVDDEVEYFLINGKKKTQKNDEETRHNIIPPDLLQIYIKIIEELKLELNCWNILNKFYKDVSEIPSKVLIACSLAEVKKENLEESKKNIRKWLSEMPKEEKEKLGEKQQPNFKFYEMIIEIYVLHILAPLEEYNSSIDFLEGEDYLTMNRKKLICDKVVEIETMKKREQEKAKEAANNKNLFSRFNEPSSSSNGLPETQNDTTPNNEDKEITKKSKQRRVSNKHQNKYDIGNAVIDGNFEPFWKILSRFLIDKAPFFLVLMVIIVIKKNPELIRGTIFERILKKLYETIMVIINIS